MPTSFRPYLPSQALLLPSDLREWVPVTLPLKQVQLLRE